MKVSKGEIFERVFVNEEVNLQIDQEAGSHVKIHVINAEVDFFIDEYTLICLILRDLHSLFLRVRVRDFCRPS